MPPLALELEALRNLSQPLEVVAGLVNATRWSHAVALTMLCYDTLLTIGDEVQFIWQLRWSVIKTFMYASRLLSFTFIFLHAGPLVGLDRSFTNKYCESISIIGGYGALLSFAMSNWILLARTRALLGRKRSYDAILILYFLLSYGITSVLVVASTTPLISTTFYSQLAHICGIVERPKVMGFIWVCPMVFETTIFIITTTRLYQRAGQAAALFGSKLLLVLYRDGVCYYLIIIGLRTWLLLSWTIFPISYMFTGYFLLWAAMSISVTRLQLNLIKVANRPPFTEDSQLYPMRTISRRLHHGEQQEESTREAISLTRVEFGSSV